MISSRFETPPFETNFLDEVNDIVSSAYGPRFDPNLAASLLSRAEGCVSTKDHLGVTAGIAIVCGAKRISMSAAAPQPTRDEKIKRHREVLLATREGQYGTWVTIGEKYVRVQNLFKETGMSRVIDVDKADTLLEGLNSSGPQYDKDDDGQLIVVSQSDSLHPGYRQQIWHWK